MATHQAEYFHPRRLGHVNLWVEDLARSERFYNEQCGLTVEFSEPDLIATFLGTGQTPHDLGMIQTTNGVDRFGRDGILQLPGSIGQHVGLNHLAWELENEVDLVDAYKRLQEHAIETDMTVDHQVAHSVYMFDPDGNYNEFYCDTVQNWRDVLHGDMDLITSHWDPLSAEPFVEGRYERDPQLRTVDSAPLHPQRVTHAVIQSPNVDRLVDFYTRIAGLSVVARDCGVIYFSGSHTSYDYNLVLVPGASAAYGHAAFEIADESALDHAIEKLSDGRLFDVVELPWKRSLFLRDPDGLTSEWYVRRQAPRDLGKRGDVALLLAA
ncbi:MAG: catechol 2,3-dioxygenase [Gammaproteobacteria bacterium]|jgi:catechol 2,3-dioxygenase